MLALRVLVMDNAWDILYICKGSEGPPMPALFGENIYTPRIHLPFALASTIQLTCGMPTDSQVNR